MRFDNFMGPTYTPSAYSVDVQDTVNWMTEKTQQPKANGAPYSLIRTPGRKLFCDPNIGPATARALYSLSGHLYAVVDSEFMEIFSNGTKIVYGAVTDDGLPAHIAGNPDQLFIVSGGNGYIAQLGALTQIADPGFPTGSAVGAAMVDQYFTTALRGTQFFQLSDLGDGTSWDPAKKAAAEASPDFILMIGGLGPEIWPFGSQTIEVFDDTGDLDFPFQARQDVVVTTGLWAPESLRQVAGQWYFMAAETGENGQTGHGIVARMSGYQVAKVSDQSVDNAVRLMTRSDDAIGFTYQENGHVFYGLYFPTADKTWVFDVSTGHWHRRTWLDPATGIEHAWRTSCVVSAFDKVIIGDRIDGKLYEQSLSYLDDGSGQLIRRTRIAPCITDELWNIVHANFTVDGNMGIGLDGVSNPDDPTYDPQMMLTWSDVGGAEGTYGNEHWRGFGKIGERKRRAIWRRLGYARRRVYKSVVTAPVDWAISGCYVNMRSTRNAA